MDKKERKVLVKNVYDNKMETILKDISLYPKAKDVLEDEALECVFRPLLTVKKIIKGKVFFIHALLALGVNEKQSKSGFAYSENGFFGFEYNGGRYKYLGSKEVFWDYKKIKGLNRYLQADFLEQKEVYLSNKTTIEAYMDRTLKRIKPIICNENLGNIKNYIESFYSYELTKYQYQATGVLRSFNEITRGWKSSRDLFLSEEEIANSMNETFNNIEYSLAKFYDITADMAYFGINVYNFMNYKDKLFVLVDEKMDKVYMLDCYN